MIFISFLIISYAALPDLCSAQSMQAITINVGEGLPSSFLTDIIHSDDGHIWMSAQAAGISRFDGNEFENFNAISELGGLYFNTLYQDERQVIWAGGEGVLSWFDGSRWAFVDVEADIFDICGLRPEELLLCTDRGLWTFDIKTSSMTSKALVNQTFYGVANVDSEIFVIGSGGVFQFDQINWQSIFTEQGKVFKDICVDDDGEMWVIENSGILFSRRRDEFEEIAKLPRGLIPTFCEIGGLGNIYIGTENGGLQIFQTVTREWQKIDEKQISFNHVTNMAFDRWDNSWIATMGGGLIKLSAANHIWRTEENGLSGSYISNLKSGPSSKTHLVYNSGRVDQMYNQLIHPFEPEWSINRKITSLVGVSSKWFGTDQGVIYVTDSIVHLLQEPSISNWQIKDILWRDSSSILTAGPDGVFSVVLNDEDSTSQMSFEVTNVHQLPTWKLTETSQGVWCFSERDLAILIDDELMIVSSAINEFYRPTDLRVFEGTTYVSTRDLGLFYLDANEKEFVLRPCPGQEILPSRQIQSIQFDDAGRLFVGTAKGIFLTVLDSAHKLIDGYLYDETTGLPSLQLNAGAASLGPNGEVLFGATTGLLQIVTRDRHPSSLVKPVLSLVHPLTAKSPIRLTADQNYLDVSVKAVDLAMPKGLRYYWQLAGVNSKWVKSSTGGQFSFLSLAPGDYLLKLKAENRDGLSSNMIQIPFSVMTPYYKKGWFIALMSMFVVGVLAMIIRRRIKMVEIQANKRHANVKMQNEILRLEQSALKLQMNPHFIFNALQSIQAKIGQGDDASARTDLQNFSKLMRSYLDHARQETITLEEEVDALQRYLHIEQSLKDHSFDFSISLPEDMDPSFFQLPPMLVQPFVENAVKHGLPQGKRGRIDIEFSWKGRYLSCQIKDNGKGFDPNRSQVDHRSAGMDVTRSRLVSLLTDTQIDPLTFENKYDDVGKIEGALVALILPILNEE